MKFLRDLYKDKPLFLTIVVGVVLFVYIVWKQNNANVVAPTAADTTGAATTGGGGSGTFVEDSYYQNTPTSISTTNTYTGTPGLAATPATPVATSTPKAPVQTTTQPATGQGLLGKGVRIFPDYHGSQYYYRGPTTGGKIIPIPLPAGTRYAPGGNGRYWYWLPGNSKQMLLTIGNG